MDYKNKFGFEKTVHFQLDLFNKSFIDSKLSDDVDENFKIKLYNCGSSSFNNMLFSLKSSLFSKLHNFDLRTCRVSKRLFDADSHQCTKPYKGRSGTATVHRKIPRLS